VALCTTHDKRSSSSVVEDTFSGDGDKPKKLNALNSRELKAFVYRDDWIRTSDLSHPKRARYQAAPHPVTAFSISGKFIQVK
jgi:hypothetical protein